MKKIFINAMGFLYMLLLPVTIVISAIAYTIAFMRSTNKKRTA